MLSDVTRVARQRIERTGLSIESRNEQSESWVALSVESFALVIGSAKSPFIATGVGRWNASQGGDGGDSSSLTRRTRERPAAHLHQRHSKDGAPRQWRSVRISFAPAALHSSSIVCRLEVRRPARQMKSGGHVERQPDCRHAPGVPRCRLCR